MEDTNYVQLILVLLSTEMLYGIKTKTKIICKDEIYSNATIEGGMRGKLVNYLGKVDGMMTCIKMNCARNHSNIAFLLNHHNCYAIICYERCKVNTNIKVFRHPTQLAIINKTVLVENVYMSPEHRIIEDILRSIPGSKDVRPAKKYADQINIKLNIRLIQILDIDEISQAVTLNVWTTQVWNNSLLTWNATQYNNIKAVNVEPSMVWTPLIILHNNADPNMGGLYTLKTRVIVQSNGTNTWFAATTLTSSCKINVKYFPYDEQICYMRFGSWSYPVHLMDLHVFGVEHSMDHYSANVEWDVIKFTARKQVSYYACCKEPFAEVVYMLHVRRKTLYYIYTLILPSSTITALMGLAFLLPPNSGERITLGVTILVTMSVYLNLASKKLPATSDNIPLLSLFYFLLFVQIGLSISATAFTLKFFFRQSFSGPVPHWARSLIMNQLSKLLRLPKFNTEKPVRTKNVTPRRKAVRFNDKVEINGNDSHSDSSYRSRFSSRYFRNGTTSPSQLSQDSFIVCDSHHSASPTTEYEQDCCVNATSSHETDFVSLHPECIQLPANSSVSDSISGISETIRLFEQQFAVMTQQSRKRTQQIICEDVDLLIDNEHKLELERYHMLEWEYVSMIIDRIFLILFVLSLVMAMSYMMFQTKDDAVTEWVSFY